MIIASAYPKDSKYSFKKWGSQKGWYMSCRELTTWEGVNRREAENNKKKGEMAQSSY